MIPDEKRICTRDEINEAISKVPLFNYLESPKNPILTPEEYEAMQKRFFFECIEERAKERESRELEKQNRYEKNIKS